MEPLMDPLIDSLMDPLMEALMDPSMEALICQKFHLPCQDASCPQSLMMESRWTGNHPDMSFHVQYTQLHDSNLYLCIRLY